MKIMTIIGTRPEIIRLCLIIKKLDKYADQVLVHTGQNYDFNLNDIFMEQLDVRKPDYFLGAKGSFGEQIGIILKNIEEIMIKEKPDRFLVLGDTNSSLAAIMAKRLGIKVFHMEAGNRCHDERVPEEVNRKIIDNCSHILLPYTERSRQNLLAEGISSENIYVTGNPIKEVLDNFMPQIDESNILEKLKIQEKNYFLVTLHRQENVDIEERLTSFIKTFNKIATKYKKPIIWSVHPRTSKRIKDLKNIKINPLIVLSEPLGLFDFVNLEKNAFCLLSDSGTVQEEGAILNVPNVTLRDTTERPETVEVGSNFLAGCDEKKIMNGIEIVTNSKSNWQTPPEYLVEDVSNRVLKIVTGFWL
jgi:UDP-N-acetylglucosamine 2-epimerase (non-hydrolysing)